MIRRIAVKFSALIAFQRTPHLSSKLALMNDLKNLSKVHFLHAAVDAGILKLLRTPASATAVARQLGVKRTDLLEALLDLGVAEHFAGILAHT